MTPTTPPPPSTPEAAGPYGGAPTSAAAARSTPVRVHHLKAMKDRGEKWAMLTATDVFTAAAFDQAGIPVLLVGDSAANTVYGYRSTLPVTVDEMLPLVKAVSRGASRALVVADLPFGSYESSPQRAWDTAVRMMKEGGAHAVKMEGGQRMADHIHLLSTNGIPVMGHVGFTPQSENTLGGFRIQGRGESADRIVADAHAVVAAGAFSVVVEMVAEQVGTRIAKEVGVPVIGIGAGPDCDAQVMTWQDASGLNSGHKARFVRAYANLFGTLQQVAQDFTREVTTGVYPGPEHSYRD